MSIQKAGQHKGPEHIIYFKKSLVSSAVVVNTHLRSSKRPLSPRWDRAGFSWIRAWRLACEPAQHNKSDNRLDIQRHCQTNTVQLNLIVLQNIYISYICSLEGRMHPNLTKRPFNSTALPAQLCFQAVTLSSQASSSMSRASMDTALLWSWSCVTSSSMPQLLKNSTLARSSTRRCLVAYNLHVCSVKKKKHCGTKSGHKKLFL